MIRTFLAFPIQVENSLLRVCAQLKDEFSSEKLRWVPEENMHLTIRFFGDVEEELVPDIAGKIAKALNEFSSAEITIKGLGKFENRSTYSVLWAGIEDPGMLIDIKGLVDTALAEVLPVQTHRKYRPHLTLARMKRIYNTERFNEAISAYEFMDFGNYRVDHLVLYQSILGEQGPVYKELSVFRFQ